MLFLASISWVYASYVIPNSGVTTAKIANQAVTQVKLAARSTGTTVGAGGVGISNSSATFSTASSSPTAITNLSVTITTTGRPIFVGLVAATSGQSAITVSGTPFAGAVYLFNGASQIANYGINPEVSIPTSSIYTIDTPSAGTYTYSAKASISGTSISVFNTRLVAYEL